MLGPPKLRLLDQPVLVAPEDLVPHDTFDRHLDANLDPVVLFKLQLILFVEGLRSERRLMATVALPLAHRWYLGYHLAVYLVSATD